MAKVMLIRHGQSANNAKAEHLRVCDPGLTGTGQLQALATAKALATYRVTQLFCSPFLRSLETMRPIAREREMKPHIHVELCEQGGCYSGHLPGQRLGQPGMGRTVLKENYSGWTIDERITESGWWHAPYETYELAKARSQRIKTWLETVAIQSDLKSSSAAQDSSAHSPVIILVIHADFIRHLVMSMLGEHWQTEHFIQLGPIGNGSISLLDFSDHKWVLHSFNSTSHLSFDLLSQ